MICYIIFLLGYFRFWVDLTWVILSFLPVYANRIYLHGDPIGFSALSATFFMPWHILNMFFIHWVVTKMGFLYIEAEVLRRGNE